MSPRPSATSVIDRHPRSCARPTRRRSARDGRARQRRGRRRRAGHRPAASMRRGQADRSRTTRSPRSSSAACRAAQHHAPCQAPCTNTIGRREEAAETTFMCPIVSRAMPARPSSTLRHDGDAEQCDREQHDRATGRGVDVVREHDAAERHDETEPEADHVGRAEAARSTSCAVATGTTINALTSSTPTTRIEMTTVHAASTASSRLSAITGRPLARANSSSLLTVNRAGPSQVVTAQDRRGQHRERDRGRTSTSW